MEGKLIKTGLNYDLITKDKDGEEIWLATSSDYKLKKLAPLKNPLTNELIQINKLSLKNCEAIENGYDLMKLAEENSHKYYDVKTTDWHCNYNGFFSGFQKALELLSNKKFSEEDVIYMIERSNKMNFTAKHLISNHKKTEWDVTFNPDEKDADGCLILKRK